VWKIKEKIQGKKENCNGVFATNGCGAIFAQGGEALSWGREDDSLW